MTWRGTTPRQYAKKIEQIGRRIFVRCAQLAYDSVVFGSAITAAPGQPVDTGYLRASWQLTFERSGLALISTNAVYAEDIEEGIGRFGPLQLRSQVGGFHSVKLTIAGFDRIVRQAAKEEAA